MDSKLAFFFRHINEDRAAAFAGNVNRLHVRVDPGFDFDCRICFHPTPFINLKLKVRCPASIGPVAVTGRLRPFYAAIFFRQGFSVLILF